MYKQAYPNWANPSESLPKQTDSDVQSNDTELNVLSLCDGSMVYNGSECISPYRIPGFTSSFSEVRVPIQSSSLNMNNYSVLFWT